MLTSFSFFGRGEKNLPDLLCNRAYWCPGPICSGMMLKHRVLLEENKLCLNDKTEFLFTLHIKLSFIYHLTLIKSQHTLLEQFFWNCCFVKHIYIQIQSMA